MAYSASMGRVGGLLSSLLGAAVIQAGPKTYWFILAAAMVCAFAGLAWWWAIVPLWHRAHNEQNDD